MTDTELERLLDGTLSELMAEMDGMTDEDIRHVSEHPVVRYIAYRVSTPAQRRELFPASEEYYQAQARIADRQSSVARRLDTMSPRIRGIQRISTIRPL